MMGCVGIREQAPPWLPVHHPLAHIEASLRHGGHCRACAAPTRLLLVTPCAHLLCVACARPARCNRFLSAPDPLLPFCPRPDTTPKLRFPTAADRS